jgi:hypothetical protein
MPGVTMADDTGKYIMSRKFGVKDLVSVGVKLGRAMGAMSDFSGSETVV